MTDFAYRLIKGTPIQQGNMWPNLDDTGYNFFARVDYDQKTWVFGLSNKLEFDDFLSWAGGNAFGDEIGNGATIDICQTIIDYTTG